MSLLQSLDEELMCAVCLEFYETPLLLPCGHNFCKNCLISISESATFSYVALGPVNSLSCPVCKASISLRKTAISQLPVNRVLENIISLYKANSPVDVFDCAWNSDVDIQVTSCPSHHHPADRYCEVCNVAVCNKCEETTHGSKTRGRHHVEPLKQIATKYQADIANSLTEIKMKNVPLNGRIQQLQERLDGVDKHEETILKELTEAISSVMSAVRQRQEDLRQQLQTNVADMKRPVLEQMTQCRGVKTLIQELTKKLSAIKKTRDAGLKIRLMKNARKQLSQLLHVDLLLALQPQTAPQVTKLTWQLSTRSFLDKLDGLHWEKRGVPVSTVVNAATQTMDEPNDTSDYNPRENVDVESATKGNDSDNNWWLPTGGNNHSDKPHRPRSSSAKGSHKSKHLRLKKLSSNPLRMSRNVLSDTNLKSLLSRDKESDGAAGSGDANLLIESQRNVNNSARTEHDKTEKDYLKSGNVSAKVWDFNLDTKDEEDTSKLAQSLDAISLCKKHVDVRKSYPPDAEKHRKLRRNDHSFNFVQRIPGQSMTGFGDNNQATGNTDKTSHMLATFVARRKNSSPSKSPSQSRLAEETSPRLKGDTSPKLPTLSATDIKPGLGNATVSISDVAIPFTKLFINNSPPQVTTSSVGDSLTELGNTTAATTNSTSSSVSSEPTNKSLPVTTAAASNPGESARPKMSFSIFRNTSSRNSPTLSFNTTHAPTTTLQTALVTSSSQPMDTQSGDSDRFSTCSESSISHQPVAGEVNEYLAEGRKIKKVVRKLRK